MKTFLLLSFLAATPAFAARYSVRVVPLESYTEKPGLPPELVGTVSLYCYERVLRPLREELTQPDGTVTIVAGALVRRDLFNPCSQGPGPVALPLGQTFSGRPFEVVPLQLQ